MAPEMIDYKGYNTTLDIWALGVVCVEMAEGFPKYWEMDGLEAMQYISRCGIPPLEGEWSEEFTHFMGQCLQKDPKKRSSAFELLEHSFIASSCSEEEWRDFLFSLFLTHL